MPPSGFSQKAINGLLRFISANYEHIMNIYGTTDEPASLHKAISALEQEVSSTAAAGRFLGVEGLAVFMTENYKDLIEEIRVGKKQPRYAMRKEIDDIDKYLKKFHI